MRFAPPSTGNVAACLALGAGVLVAKGVKEAWPFWSGHCGETSVRKALAKLGPEYVCVTNFVATPSRPGDMDLILFGPFGILIIEVKAYSQPVRCHGEKWSIMKGNGSWKSVRSVSDQCRRNVKKLERLTVAPVMGTVVFGDFVPMQIHDCPVNVIRRRGLLEYVRSLPAGGYDAHELSAAVRTDAKLRVK